MRRRRRPNIARLPEGLAEGVQDAVLHMTDLSNPAIREFLSHADPFLAWLRGEPVPDVEMHIAALVRMNLEGELLNRYDEIVSRRLVSRIPPPEVPPGRPLH